MYRYNIGKNHENYHNFYTKGRMIVKIELDGFLQKYKI